MFSMPMKLIRSVPVLLLLLGNLAVTYTPECHQYLPDTYCEQFSLTDSMGHIEPPCITPRFWWDHPIRNREYTEKAYLAEAQGNGGKLHYTYDNAPPVWTRNDSNCVFPRASDGRLVVVPDLPCENSHNLHHERKQTDLSIAISDSEMQSHNGMRLSKIRKSLNTPIYAELHHGHLLSANKDVSRESEQTHQLLVNIIKSLYHGSISGTRKASSDFLYELLFRNTPITIERTPFHGQYLRLLDESVHDHDLRLSDESVHDPDLCLPDDSIHDSDRLDESVHDPDLCLPDDSIHDSDRLDESVHDPDLCLPDDSVHVPDLRLSNTRSPTPIAAMSAYISSSRQSRVLLAVRTEAITGLTVESNSPIVVGDKIILTVHLRTGTNILFRFLHVGYPDIDVVSSAPVYSMYIYNTGVYAFQVEAYNDLSHQQTTAYVLVVIGTNSVSMDGPCCVRVGEVFTLTAVEAGLHTDTLYFTWVFGEGTTYQGYGMNSVSHHFSEAGKYAVDLSIRSAYGFIEGQHTTIHVQVPVQGVGIVAPSLASLPPAGVTAASIEASVQTGSDFTFYWDLDPMINADLSDNVSHWIFQAPTVGTFNISLVVTNDVSEAATFVLLHVQELISNLQIVINGSTITEYYECGPFYLFEALSTGSEIEYSWKVSPSPGTMKMSGNSMLVNFPRTSVYNIKVDARNAVTGKVSQKENITVVYPVSNAGIISNATVVIKGDQIDYRAAQGGSSPLSIDWQICRDGCVSIDNEEFAIQLTINVTGAHDVCANISNPVSYEKVCVLTNVMRQLETIDLCDYGYHSVIYISTWTMYEFVVCDPHDDVMSITLSLHDSQSRTIVQSTNSSILCHAFVDNGQYDLITESYNISGPYSTTKILVLQDTITDVQLHSNLNGVIDEVFRFQLTMISGSDIQVSWQTRNSAHRLISYEVSNGTDYGYVFSRGGSYTITAYVCNYVSFSTESRGIDVQGPTQNLSIVTDVSTFPFLPTQQAVRFTYANRIDGNIDQIAWTLIEGTDTAHHNYAALSHTFTLTGTAEVILSLSIDGVEYVTNDTLFIQHSLNEISITDHPYAAVGNEAQFACNTEQGTNLNYIWNTSATTPFVTGRLFITTFYKPGPVTVYVTAYNNVSEERAQVTTMVLERISGVFLSNCCSQVVPANSEWIIKALTATGNDIRYEWIIDGTLLSSNGRTLKHIFHDEGQHNVVVNCSNAMSWSHVVGLVQVQDAVKAVQVFATDHVLAGETVPVNIATPGCQCNDITAEWFVNGLHITSTHSRFVQLIFSSEGAFNITVLVKNDISSSAGWTNVVAHLLGCQLPTLHSYAASRLVYHRSDNIIIQVAVQSDCNQYRLGYAWSVTAGLCSETGDPLGLLPVFQVADPILTIPPMTLDYGNFCSRLTVELLGSPSSVTVTEKVDIAIITAQPMAIIQGGSERLVDSGVPLQLDASLSFNPDVPFPSLHGMEYIWSCRPLVAGELADCFDELNGRTLILPAQSLIADGVYQLSLTVVTSDGSNATAEQKVIAIEGRVPSITIECTSCHMANSHQIRTGQPIKLVAKCPLCLPTASYHWSLSTGAGVSIPLTSDTCTTGTDQPWMVVTGDVFVLNEPYEFMAKVMSGNFDIPGYSKLRLTPNPPPIGGQCTVNPSHVYGLQPISVSCSGYSDPNGIDGMPLSYKYYAYNPGNPGKRNLLYQGPDGHKVFYLSPWEDNANRVGLEVNVMDMEEAATKALDFFVTIHPARLGPGETRSQYLLSNWNHTFPSLLSMGQLGSLIQYSTAFVMAINHEDTATSIPLATLGRIYSAILYAIQVHNGSITTLGDAQQVASMLVVLTMNVDIFASDLRLLLLVVQILECILYKLTKSVSQSVSLSDINPSNYLQVMDNLFRIGSHGSEHVSVVLKTNTLVNQLAYACSLTQVQGEKAFEFASETMTLNGMRVVSNGNTGMVNISGASVVIPRLMSVGIDLVRVSYVMDQNPYVQINSSQPAITTTVFTTAYLNPDGNTHEVNRFEADEMMLIMPKQPHHVIQDPTLYEYSIPPSLVQTVKIGCDQNGGSIHIVIVAQVIHGNHLDTANNFSLVVFMRKDALPSAVSYDQRVYISHSGDVAATMSGDTIFINECPPSGIVYVSLLNAGLLLNVSVSLWMYGTVCQFFNTTTLSWDRNGCRAGPESTPEVTYCYCSHLTAFGSSTSIGPSQISFVQLKALDVESNPVCLILLGALLALYLPAMAWARRRDLQDVRQLGAIPQCGSDGPYKYQITIRTGRAWGAGTSANVGIRLCGEEGRSPPRLLSHGGAFQRNGDDTVLIATQHFLGNLYKVHVWHDNAGASPSWFLASVTVRDFQSNKTYYFLCDCWLALDKEGGVIEKEVPVAVADDLDGFRTIFTSETTQGFAERHLWLSLVDRPPRSRFTRVQRVTCVLTLTLTFLAVDILWYALLAAPSTLAWALGEVSLEWADGVVGIMCCLAVFPVTYGISGMFKYARPEHDASDFGVRPGTAQTIEMDALCELSKAGSSLVSNPDLALHSPIPSNLSMSTGSQASMEANALHRTQKGTRLPAELGPDIDKALAREPKSRKSSAKSLTSLVVPTSAGRRVYNKDGILRWTARRSSKVGPASDEQLTDAIDNPSSVSHPTTATGSATSSLPLDGEQDLTSATASSSRKVSAATSGSGSFFHLPLEVSHKPSTVTSKRNSTCDSEVSAGKVQLSSVTLRGARKYSGLDTETLVALEEIDQNLKDQDEDAAMRRVLIRNKSEESVMGGRWGDIIIPKEWPRSDSDSDDSEAVESSIDGATSAAGFDFLHPDGLDDMLGPPPSPHRCVLPRGVVYVAYTMCAVLCILSAAALLLYGQAMGQQLALKWLLAAFSAFLSSVFIIEPIKVLSIAALLGLMSRSPVEHQEESIVRHPMLQPSETIKDVRVRPLAGYGLLHARQEGVRLQRLRMLARQTLAYFVFIWAVIVVAYTTRPSQGAHHVRLSGQIFLLPWEPNSLHFRNVSSVNLWWQWMETTLIPGLYSVTPSTSQRHVVGEPTILKTQRTPVACVTHGVPRMQDLALQQCYTNDLGDDLDNQRVRRNITLPDGQVLAVNSPSPTRSYPLGPSSREALLLVGSLRESGWLDRSTRSVSIEFALFDTPTGVFVHHKITAFIHVSGKVVHSARISPVQLLATKTHQFPLHIFIHVPLVLVVIYLTCHVTAGLIKRGCCHVMDMWRAFEVAMVTVGWASLGVFISCVLADSRTARFLTPSERFNGALAESVALHETWTELNAWLLFLLCIWVSRQGRFLRSTCLTGKVLTSARPFLLGIAVLTTLVTVAYAQLAWLWYSGTDSSPRSFPSAIPWLWSLLRGQGYVSEDLSAGPNQAFSRLFLVSYWLVMQVLVMGGTITVLITALHSVRLQLQYNSSIEDQDYDIGPFAWRQLKQWLGLAKPKPAYRQVKFQGLPSLSRSTSWSYSWRSVSFPSLSPSRCSSSSSAGLGPLDALHGETQRALQALMERTENTWKALVEKLNLVVEMDIQEDIIVDRLLEEANKLGVSGQSVEKADKYYKSKRRVSTASSRKASSGSNVSRATDLTTCSPESSGDSS